ncbi:hypothetical protein [Nocardioides sp. BYT-33-1]|uniref:hypothetical protein n=1 Tax=Nocardioides sp. BYT-33-1 TaxID=3416952 RepID=UPI003F52E87E
MSVESTHGAATTVFVEVRAPSQGLRDILDRCGVDSGYERVFCETDPLIGLKTSAGRNRDGEALPDFEVLELEVRAR